MPKTVTLRLAEDSYERLKAAASADRRTLANLIEIAALRYLEDSSFTDEAETREILSNRGLRKRLAAGHAAARKRKGSVVRGV